MSSANGPIIGDFRGFGGHLKSQRIDEGKGILSDEEQALMLSGELELPAFMKSFYARHPDLLSFRKAEAEYVHVQTDHLMRGTVPPGVWLNGFEVDIRRIMKHFRVKDWPENVLFGRKPEGP